MIPTSKNSSNSAPTAGLTTKLAAANQTFDIGTDVELAAAGAEVDLRRRLVHLRRRAEDTHGVCGKNKRTLSKQGQEELLSASYLNLEEHKKKIGVYIWRRAPRWRTTTTR